MSENDDRVRFCRHVSPVVGEYHVLVPPGGMCRQCALADVRALAAGLRPDL